MASMGLSVLALPENILAISRIGRDIVHKIRVYRNAPNALTELREFGVQLYQGQFYLDIKLAQAFATDFNDHALSEQLESQLRRLKTGLDQALTILAKSYDDRGKVDKTRFTLSVEKQLGENLKKLRTYQEGFFELVRSVDILRHWRESMNLTHDKFLPSINDRGGYCQPVPGTSHAYFGHAEWKDRQGERTHPRVLFEKHDVGARILGEVLEVLQYLAAHLPRHPPPDTGILRCLGYRKEPTPELVFEIPFNYSGPRTLRTFLDTNTGRLSRTSRHRFAFQVSAAISNAQGVGLIHKNIRPDSILVFKEMGAQEGSSSRLMTWMPFLTNWTLARTEQMLSYRQGNDDWQQNLYRHPQRQGLHVEERYHAGHDIYSLGVCLLEIGLGEPLIVLDDKDESNLCELFQKEAIELRLVTTENTSNACRNLKPWDRAKTLYGMSQGELRSRMGLDYSAIVQECLQCIEKGFGPIRDFKHEEDKVISVFQDEILKPLEKLS